MNAVNQLLNAYTHWLITSPHIALAVTILVIAVGLWLVCYPRRQP
jgi:hypothetical protein